MTTVLAGHTYTLSGTLGAFTTLTANAGTYSTPAGGLIQVTTSATNNGTISLLGGPGVYSGNSAFHPHPTGGTLTNTGTLANNGLISLAGGSPGTDFASGTVGAQLNNSGTLTNAGTIKVAGAVSIGDSVVATYATGATLHDTGALTNTGMLTVYGGQRGSGTGAAAAGNVIVSGVMTNSGQIDVKGGTAPNFYFYASPFASGGQFSVASTGSLTNTGTFTAEGNAYGPGGLPLGATISISGSFTNSGVFVAQGGDNALYDPGYGALVNINAGGKFTNNGGLTLGGGSPYLANYPGPDAGATLTNAGLLTNAAGAVLTIEGQAGAGYHGGDGASGALLINSGSLTNAGSIQIYGAPFDAGGYRTGGELRDSGSLTNTGDITVDGFTNAVGGGAGSAPGGNLIVSGVLTNTGVIFAEGGAGSYYSAGYAPIYGAQIAIAAGGTLTSSGTLYLTHGRAAAPGAAAGATLTDSGLLTNSGQLTVRAGYGFGNAYGRGALLSVTAGAKLNNTGHLDIVGAYSFYHSYPVKPGTGGTLINAGTFTNSGTVIVHSTEITGKEPQGSAGLLSDVGVLQNAVTGVISVGGGGGDAYNRSPGGTLAVSGSLANSGQITLHGGYLGGSFYNYGYGFGFGAQLNVTGILNNSGTVLAGGAIGGYTSEIGTSASINVTGTLTNTKLIELQGGQTLPPAGKNGPITPGAQLTDAKVLNNNGTILLDAGKALHDQAGTLTVLSGATLTNTGTISGPGTLINGGTILSGSAKTGDLAESSFINNGLVKVTPNFALRVDGKVTAGLNKTGTFDLTSGSTLTLNGGVGASQQVAFLTGASTLDLGSVSTFSGVLAGLHPTDTIDFLHTNVASASASGTTLTLNLSGGGTLALKLSAPLPTSDTLTLHSDGTGGTDLVIGSTGGAVFAAGEPMAFDAPVSGWVP